MPTTPLIRVPSKIVPQAESLQAEVLLANEDVGFVTVGQNAQIKIAAFPFTKYGLLEGSVIHVGADASDPKQSNSPQAATAAVPLCTTSPRCKA